MARPSVVRADWEQREGERAGGGGAKFLPSIWRAAQPWPGPNNCLSEDFLAPTPRPRHKTLHPFEFKWEARQAGLEPLTRIALSKKQRYPFPYESWVGNKFFPLWRWLILILVVNSSLMLSLLINHYFKYGSIMWHLFLSIMINQMGTRLEYTSSCCHRFLPVTRAHGVMGRNVWNDDTLICTLIRFYGQLFQAWHLSISQREAIVSKKLRLLQKIDKGVCPQ